MDSIPVIIIGAGPSGLAASIQLKRQGIECLVFEKDSTGGLLNNANLVENYPGFPGGIKGPDLVNLILEQARQNGVRIIQAEVKSLVYQNDQFVVKTEATTYHSQIVLITSGTQPKLLPGLVIPEDCNSRVSYEVYRLGDLQNKTVVVVGAGDAAYDYSLNLAESNNRITILNRGNKSSALPLLKKRVEDHEKIDCLTSSSIQSISLNANGQIDIEISQSGGMTQIEADHLVIAVGREPSDYFLSGEIKNQLSGLQAEGRLYIVGDVSAGMYRQTSIAIGEAVRAAMMIQNRLKDLG